MTAIVTNDVRFLHSENFVNSIKNADQTLYSFLGKSDSWSAGQGTPINSHERFLEDSIDINVMERVYYKNLSNVSKYVVHTSGTTYSMYDHTVDMAGSTFFVVNPANKGVYKCLFNNPTAENPSGSSSTQTPDTLVTSGVQTTTDHYVWKYMYSIPTEWGEPIDTEIEGLPLWMSIKNVMTREENSSQWDVRLNSLPGGIHAFRWVNTPNPSLLPNNSVVTVSRDNHQGVSFVGKVNDGRIICDPNIDNSSNPGSGYTSYTSVNIDGNSVDFIEPILSPSGGHGSDPIRELNGYYLLIESTISNTLEIGIGFKKIGLILNPLRKIRTNGDTNAITNVSSNGIVIGEKLGKKTVFPIEESTSDYLRYSGKVIYIENLSNSDAESITPGTGIKQVKLILSF